MRRSLGLLIRGQAKWLVLQGVWPAALLVGSMSVLAGVKQSDTLEAGRRAYESSDYSKAVIEFQTAAAKEAQNGEIQLMLTKSYLELQERDAAINSAERAVAIDPKSSVYHEWLGRAYGDKADHSAMFAALGLARKTFSNSRTLPGQEYERRSVSASG